MKLYALIGSTAFAVDDLLELNELITSAEKDVLVFDRIILWDGGKYTPSGCEIDEIVEEWE